jgi:hypothetical protein
MDKLLALTRLPQFNFVLFYLTTLFGAIAMYVFALSKGFDGAIPFLKKFFPQKSEAFYNRADFVIVIFAGSIIGTICFSPQNSLQALAAGFGWVGAVNVLMTQKPPA